jgi:hypothetical protein
MILPEFEYKPDAYKKMQNKHKVSVFIALAFIGKYVLIKIPLTINDTILKKECSEKKTELLFYF